MEQVKNTIEISVKGNTFNTQGELSGGHHSLSKQKQLSKFQTSTIVIKGGKTPLNNGPGLLRSRRGSITSLKPTIKMNSVTEQKGERVMIGKIKPKFSLRNINPDTIGSSNVNI
jgi:hypothetical protein